MRRTVEKSVEALLSAAVVCAVSACSTVENASRRPDAVLDVYRAMAYGSIVELNHLDPDVEKNLVLRLYELPIEVSGCFSETSGACANKYFLSVSSFDEHPVWDVVALDHIGKLDQPRWIESRDIDSAIVSFAMARYTDEAVANNPSLAPVSEPIRLLIKVIGNSVSVSEIR